MFDRQDYYYMARALKLAKKGLYTTDPNPKVGCVIVKNTRILSEGWTQKAGQEHAEIHAINLAKIDITGSTMYVTLEPCSHYARTPPCVDAIIKSGVSRIVIAINDPNPKINGSGINKLVDAGIRVESGLLSIDARELNKGFFSLHERRRPWIRLKTAASIDGVTAMESGQSQWITGNAARRDGHRLRGQSSAVLTGVGTILADDPQLNVRIKSLDRQPMRVVLDSSLRTPANARILNPDGDVLVLTCKDSDCEQALELKSKGAHVITLLSDRGRLNLPGVVETLAKMNVNELHVEAGRTLTGEFINNKLADELVVYLAPKLLGDNTRGMFTIPGLENLEQHIKVEWSDHRMVGDDLRLNMRFMF